MIYDYMLDKMVGYAHFLSSFFVGMQSHQLDQFLLLFSAKMVSEIYRSEWSNFELGNRRPIGRSENFHLVFQMNTDKTYLLRWE